MSWVDLTEQEQRPAEREIDWALCRRKLGQTATIEQVMRGDYAVQCSVPRLVVAIQSIESNENDPTRALRTNRTLLTCILADETGSIVGNIETSLVTRTHALEEYDVILIEPVPLLTVNNMPTIFVVQSRIRGIIKHNEPLSEPSMISQQPFDRSQIDSQINHPSNHSQHHRPQQPVHHQTQQSQSVTQASRAKLSRSPSPQMPQPDSQASYQVSQPARSEQQYQQWPAQHQQRSPTITQPVQQSLEQPNNRAQNVIRSPSATVLLSQQQPQPASSTFSRKAADFDPSELDDLDM